MADEKKRRKRTKTTSGRATPPTSTSRKTTRTANESSRYTPPEPMKFKRPSRLIPILMFTFFGLGVAIILLNYLPGAPLVGTIGGWLGMATDTSNSYLLIGLLFICFGFAAATKYE